MIYYKVKEFKEYATFQKDAKIIFIATDILLGRRLFVI
jgi:hypothetical protein